MLAALNYREREIIRLRYGLADGYAYTLEEVGKIFSVTRERVRQIEAKAVRKLQHPIRSRKLSGIPGAADPRTTAAGRRWKASKYPSKKQLRRADFSPPRRAKARPTSKPRSCTWTGTNPNAVQLT